MTDLAVAYLTYFAGTLFQAATGIVGREAYEAIKVGLDRRVLKNHDVQRALLDSHVAALGMVQQLYKKEQSPSWRHWRQCKRSFRRLRDAGQGLLTAATGPFDHAESLSLIPLNDARAEWFVDELMSADPDMPGSLTDFLRTHLPAAFAFAFSELGIKRSQAVRAAVTQGILTVMSDTAQETRDIVEEIKTTLLRQPGEVIALQTQIAQFQSEFQSSTHKRFDDVLAKLEALEDAHAFLIDSVHGRKDPDGPVLGVLTISDGDGHIVFADELRAGSLTLGRAPGSDITLPEQTISWTHATIEAAPAAFRVVDHGSSNGTLLNGERLEAEGAFDFEDELTLGNFVITVLPPDAENRLLPARTRTAAFL